MIEYRFTRRLPVKSQIILELFKIYNIKQIGKYTYEVYDRENNYKIGLITSKVLNYCFERVK